MRVLLHAGLAKTGSTSIQKTLTSSRSALAGCGVLYPDLGEGHPHHGMLVPTLFTGEDWRREYGPPTDQRRDRMRVLSDAAWAALIAAARPDALMVVSSEHFASLREPSLRLAAERLGAVASSVTPVVYFRRPADHFLSKLQQGFKASYALKDPAAHRNQFRKITTKLKNVFGVDPVIRVFDPTRFENGNVVADFACEVLGLSRSDFAGLTLVRDNASLSAEGMLLMSRFRAECYPRSDGVFNPQSKALLRAIQAEEARRPYTRARLHPEIAARIDCEHAAELLWLRDEAGLTLPGVDYAALAQGPAGDAAAPAPPTRLDELIAVDEALADRMALRVLNALAAAPR